MYIKPWKILNTKSLQQKKPVSIPKLKTIPFLKPTFFALFIDIILFGPGV
jgi:hypothetical protein